MRNFDCVLGVSCLGKRRGMKSRGRAVSRRPNQVSRHGFQPVPGDQLDLLQTQALAEIFLFLATHTPDVVSRTAILVHEHMHHTNVLAAFQRLPKGIVGQNRGGWHFALADFAEGLSSSHRVSLISVCNLSSNSNALSSEEQSF